MHPSLQACFNPPVVDSRPLPSCHLFVDLFADASAPLSQAMAALGLSCLEPLDKLHGCRFDLLDPVQYADSAVWLLPAWLVPQLQPHHMHKTCKTYMITICSNCQVNQPAFLAYYLACFRLYGVSSVSLTVPSEARPPKHSSNRVSCVAHSVQQSQYTVKPEMAFIGVRALLYPSQLPQRIA